MTVVAGVATGDMILVLAGGRDTVVTGATAADHLGVIDGKRRYEYVGRVAVLADIRGANVLWVFAGTVGAIVTADTVVHDVGMVKVCGHPASGCMAIVAAVAALYMVLVLAGRDNTIVAGAAGPYDLRVIHGKHRREYIGRMAILADIRS